MCNTYTQRRSSGSNALNSVSNRQCAVLAVLLQLYSSTPIYMQLF